MDANMGEPSSSPPMYLQTTPQRPRTRQLQFPNQAILNGQDLPSLAHGSSSPLFESPSTVRHPNRIISTDQYMLSPRGNVNMPLMLPSSPPEIATRIHDGSPKPRAQMYKSQSSQGKSQALPSSSVPVLANLQKSKVGKTKRRSRKQATSLSSPSFTATPSPHGSSGSKSLEIPPRPSSVDFAEACQRQNELHKINGTNAKKFSGSQVNFIIDSNTGRAEVSPYKRTVRTLDSVSLAAILAEDSDSETDHSHSSTSSPDESPTRTVGRRAICDAAAAFARVLTRSRVGMARSRGYRVAETPSRRLAGASNFFYHPPNTPATSKGFQLPVTPIPPVQLMSLRQVSTQTPPGAVLGCESMSIYSTGMTPYLPRSVN